DSLFPRGTEPVEPYSPRLRATEWKHRLSLQAVLVVKVNVFAAWPKNRLLGQVLMLGVVSKGAATFLA
ncbi:MAG TPA: hypothetical protein VK638_16220, partial [Edaphobacter sp.]|nr:hypothetical protein [Edaphobacter sp.]